MCAGSLARGAHGVQIAICKLFVFGQLCVCMLHGYNHPIHTHSPTHTVVRVLTHTHHLIHINLSNLWTGYIASYIIHGDGKWQRTYEMLNVCVRDAAVCQIVHTQAAETEWHFTYRKKGFACPTLSFLTFFFWKPNFEIKPRRECLTVFISTTVVLDRTSSYAATLAVSSILQSHTTFMTVRMIRTTTAAIYPWGTACGHVYHANDILSGFQTE